MNNERFAGIVGVTRSRISQFMKKFRKFGPIDYGGQELLSLVGTV